MQKSAKRPIIAASAFGLIAAVPIVIFFVFGSDYIDSPIVRILIFPAIALCPPWWIFWSVLGSPDDMQYVLKLSCIVLVLNALLYAPIGLLYKYSAEHSPIVRTSVMTVGFLFILLLGNLFFMLEPEPISALLASLRPN